MTPVIHKQKADFLASITGLVAPGTLESYRTRLEAFDAPEANSEAVRRFVVKLQEQGLAKHTILAYVSTLKQFGAWLVTNKLATVNPVVVPKIKGRTQRKIPITEEEHGRILAKANPMWLYGATMAYHTGLRLGDIAMLEWASVDMAGRSIKLTPRKTQRFSKEVEIPFGSEVEAVLMTQITDMTLVKDGKFVCPDMARMYQIDRHKTLSVYFSRLAVRGGVKGKSFHAYRWGFVSRMLARGVSAEMISTITGQTVEQVMRYQNVTLDQKRKALGIV